MEQHPVPQHIASYEFRLVGDMTLKQFAFLAGGAVVALIFYASPLPWYFKWPGVISFGLLGFALAFLPLQEKSLHQWIIAYIKAIFSPTQYVWKKRPFEPEIFKAKPKRPPARRKPTLPPDQVQLSEYLKTLPLKKAKSPIEEQEENFLKQIASLFQLARMPAKPSYPTPTPPPSTVPVRPPKPKPKIVQPEFIKPKVPPEIKAAREELPTIKTGRPVVLPEIPGRPKRPTVAAKVTLQLPIPTPPNKPNFLVGMVLDKNDQMIEGAILEIRNSKGIPVRALKTNKLGQFRIATPLENDTYEIETEKEGYLFDIIKIEVKGQIIQPIEIRAK